MLPDEVETGCGEQLERSEAIAAARLDVLEQTQRVARGAERGDRGGLGTRLGIELQHGGGDDPERPLGADEKLLQVVAGVVLAQPAKPFPDLARRQDDLQAEDEIARGAVSEHLHAASVRREVPADLAAALCR